MGLCDKTRSYQRYTSRIMVVNFTEVQNKLRFYIIVLDESKILPLLWSDCSKLRFQFRKQVELLVKRDSLYKNKEILHLNVIDKAQIVFVTFNNATYQQFLASTPLQSLNNPHTHSLTGIYREMTILNHY